MIDPVATVRRPALTRLALTDFRSYAAADLRLDGRIVVLTGPNGAGKTNLLEAVSFLAPGRGLRRAALSAVDRIGGAGGWAVSAVLELAGGPVSLGTGRLVAEGGERRAVHVEGVPQRGQTALSDRLAIAWLTPQMDRLFIEGTSGRRRFFDRLVHGFAGGHASALAAYEQAMRERARLLREGGRRDAAWLAGLEDAMARHGLAVAAARRELLARLQVAVEEGIGPFPAADLSLDGEVESWLDDMTALDAEDRFRSVLAERRGLDSESGVTGTGPHRTDLSVRHRLKAMPAEACSTGEQKALLIAIQLAFARLLRELRGAAPLLLLDEIAAHLDAARRAALYDELAALEGQSWLTGTDAALFHPLGEKAQRFQVADGRIIAE